MKSSNTILKPHLPKFKQVLCITCILYSLFILNACDSEAPSPRSTDQVDQDLADQEIEEADQAIIPDLQQHVD